MTIPEEVFAIVAALAIWDGLKHLLVSWFNHALSRYK